MTWPETDIGHFSTAFPVRGVPLHAMLTSCGRQRVESVDYSWDGLKRGTAAFVVFQYTLAGCGRLDFEGRGYDLPAGSAFLVTLPHRHWYGFPSGGRYWEFVYACATGREVLRLARILLASQGPVLRLAAESPPLRIMVRLLKRARSGDFSSPYAASAAVYDLMMALLETTGTGALPDASAPQAVRRAQRFCREHFADPVGVAEMAAAAGLSRYHFSRVFKTCTGMAPMQYLNDMRLREAARLLLETDLKLKEIAPRCCFPDGNYLCKVFQKNFGVSPGAFRKTGFY